MKIDGRALGSGLAGLLAALAFGGLPRAALATYTLEQPTLKLEAVGEEDLNLAASTDWRKDRLIEGIGWKIASAVRDPQGGLSAVMRCGYTVILPMDKQGLPYKHMYVLAGFDLLPAEELLLTVRDPEQYWPEYNYKDGVTDPLELVWYDKNWNEESSTVVNFPPGSNPDDFRMNENQTYVLAITHPVDSEGRTPPEGSSLKLIYLHDGSVIDVPLPEADEAGILPSEWYPLKMDWDDKGRLLVQTSLGFRIYSVEW